jgi:hypothetical protein
MAGPGRGKTIDQVLDEFLVQDQATFCLRGSMWSQP